MRPFFCRQDSQAALERAAFRWQGTPFRHNSQLRGLGANCVGAIVGVLEDAGFRVPAFDLVPACWSRYQTRSAMEEWLDAQRPKFEMVVVSKPHTGEPWPETALSALLPGDVVGFKVGLCIHHLGLVLAGGRFFQCNESLGAIVLSQAEREFKTRVVKAWRPMEEIAQ